MLHNDVRAPNPIKSIFKQIIKVLLTIILLVRLGGDAPRLFHHVARLIHIAEVVFVFFDNILINIFAALISAGRIKMPASATTSERGPAVETFIGAGDFAEYPGRLATTPAYESVGGALSKHKS